MNEPITALLCKKQVNSLSNPHTQYCPFLFQLLKMWWHFLLYRLPASHWYIFRRGTTMTFRSSQHRTKLTTVAHGLNSHKAKKIYARTIENVFQDLKNFLKWNHLLPNVSVFPLIRQNFVMKVTFTLLLSSLQFSEYIMWSWKKVQPFWDDTW